MPLICAHVLCLSSATHGVRVFVSTYSKGNAELPHDVDHAGVLSLRYRSKGDAEVTLYITLC